MARGHMFPHDPMLPEMGYMLVTEVGDAGLGLQRSSKGDMLNHCWSLGEGCRHVASGCWGRHQFVMLSFEEAQEIVSSLQVIGQ